MELEVQAREISDLEAAYLELINAKSELERIKTRNRIRLLAQSLMERASAYWIEDEEGRRVSSKVNTGNGMILSLLDCYPSCKTGTTIASEIGKDQSTVSLWFSGTRGNYSQYFEECDDGYRLSEQGVESLSEWLYEQGRTEE
ncbi:hypothetical protein EU537_10310 [Candidatus Thorarchaeota archaeon]|nr:MAG: hypothetical protein EU537_10310 [Candidatus Thorarchaeota archaeon]